MADFAAPSQLDLDSWGRFLTGRPQLAALPTAAATAAPAPVPVAAAPVTAATGAAAPWQGVSIGGLPSLFGPQSLARAPVPASTVDPGTVSARQQNLNNGNVAAAIGNGVGEFGQGIGAAIGGQLHALSGVGTGAMNFLRGVGGQVVPSGGAAAAPVAPGVKTAVEAPAPYTGGMAMMDALGGAPMRTPGATPEALAGISTLKNSDIARLQANAAIRTPQRALMENLQHLNTLKLMQGLAAAPNSDEATKHINEYRATLERMLNPTFLGVAAGGAAAGATQ
jgi:hypothetical protein